MHVTTLNAGERRTRRAGVGTKSSSSSGKARSTCWCRASGSASARGDPVRRLERAARPPQRRDGADDLSRDQLDIAGDEEVGPGRLRAANPRVPPPAETPPAAFLRPTSRPAARPSADSLANQLSFKRSAVARSRNLVCCTATALLTAPSAMKPTATMLRSWPSSRIDFAGVDVRTLPIAPSSHRPRTPRIGPRVEQRRDRHVEGARLVGLVGAVAALTARAQPLDALVADGHRLRPPAVILYFVLTSAAISRCAILSAP